MDKSGGDNTESVDAEHFRYTRLCFDGDVLIGAIIIGATEHVGVLRGLIQSRTKLGTWKDRLLQNPLALMEAYLATAQLRNLVPTSVLNR